MTWSERVSLWIACFLLGFPIGYALHLWLAP